MLIRIVLSLSVGSALECFLFYFLYKFAALFWLENDKTEGSLKLFLVLLLLLLLSRVSRVWRCETPWMAAHQAPLSLGFSRQEHWSGLPFPSLVHESEKWKEVTQSCPTLSDPMDCSLPGSSAHGIFQARVLEWVAIAFSALWFWPYIIHS